MSTWASEFLREDMEDFGMADKLFYQRQWAEQAREAAHKAISMAREAQKRETERPLSEKYYGDRLLRANGICPECLYMFQDCQCDLPFADAREVSE